jgi:hypothetical protein
MNPQSQLSNHPHRLGRRACSALALLALLILGTPVPAGAVLPFRTTRLSYPALPATQDVTTNWVTPDGRIAVFAIRDAATGALVDLRCVRLDANSDPVSLTTGLSDAFRYDSIQVAISPDSRRVAFVAYVPSGTGTAAEVWGAPLCPSTVVPVRLSPAGAPVASASLYYLRFTPNSARVLFETDHVTSSRYRVYSAPATGASGGPTVELGGARESGTRIVFAPTADSQRVVLGRRNAAGFVDLVSVPVVGRKAPRRSWCMGRLRTSSNTRTSPARRPVAAWSTSGETPPATTRWGSSASRSPGLRINRSSSIRRW